METFKKKVQTAFELAVNGSHYLVQQKIGKEFQPLGHIDWKHNGVENNELVMTLEISEDKTNYLVYAEETVRETFHCLLAKYLTENLEINNDTAVSFELPSDIQVAPHPLVGDDEQAAEAAMQNALTKALKVDGGPYVVTCKETGGSIPVYPSVEGKNIVIKFQNNPSCTLQWEPVDDAELRDYIKDLNTQIKNSFEDVMTAPYMDVEITLPEQMDISRSKTVVIQSKYAENAVLGQTSNGRFVVVINPGPHTTGGYVFPSILGGLLVTISCAFACGQPGA